MTYKISQIDKEELAKELGIDRYDLDNFLEHREIGPSNAFTADSLSPGEAERAKSAFRTEVKALLMQTKFCANCKNSFYTKSDGTIWCQLHDQSFTENSCCQLWEDRGGDEV